MLGLPVALAGIWIAYLQYTKPSDEVVASRNASIEPPPGDDREGEADSGKAEAQYNEGDGETDVAPQLLPPRVPVEEQDGEVVSGQQPPGLPSELSGGGDDISPESGGEDNTKPRSVETERHEREAVEREDRRNEEQAAEQRKVARREDGSPPL